MPKQKFGLGRGLDALIPGTTVVSDEAELDTSLEASSVFEAPTEAISPNPLQPRAPVGDDEQIRELAVSIQQYGLLQPLLVRIEGADGEEPTYQLIAGERRLRAARLAGLERVPVIIRDATPQLMLEMALVENLQRADLNPIEEAQGYAMLVEEYGLTQEQVAERIGRNRATVANTLRLLQLPVEVRDALVMMPKVFTEGHARAVLQINGETERLHATKQIIAQKMSVRAAEELARRYNEAALRLAPDRRGSAQPQRSYDTERIENEITRAIELKVRLQKNTKGKGSLTVFFNTDDQLQRVYGMLLAASGNGHDAFAYGEGGTVESLLDETIDLSAFGPLDEGPSEN